MLGNLYTKDPQAVLDFTVDWSQWLASGDTITSVTWTVPVGITQGSTSNTTTTATIWLSGGTVGTSYSIGCRITTAQGRTDERTFVVRVQDK